MDSQLYDEWLKARYKGDMRFYNSEEFRWHYTARQMQSKVNIFTQRALNDVRAVLRSIWSQTNRNEIRILSLGCGPGSDLLGLLGAVDSVLRSDVDLVWKARVLQCHCIGVDAFHWNPDAFRWSLNDLVSTGSLGTSHYQFLHQDMQTFVFNCFRGFGPREFDFICLSFVDAGSNLQLIGTALPQLLSPFGCVLVLDNNISAVRSLTEHGYTRTYSSRVVCMHSRGQGSRPSEPYKPSPDSPIQRYRKQILQLA